jgi:hypothetical protein
MTENKQIDVNSIERTPDYQAFNDQKMVDQLEYDIRRLEKLLNRVLLSSDPVQKTLAESYRMMIEKREELLALLYERQMSESAFLSSGFGQKAG